MKSTRKLTALLLALILIIGLPCCQCASEPEESSVLEQESEEPSEESEESEEESSKPQESSKKKEVAPQEVDSTREILSDFTGLLSQNSDTVGWVNVPNTAIDYVVLQAPDDAVRMAYGEDPFYLCRDFNKNDYFSGSIFMDFRSELDDRNRLLHGHSMANGTMFASILSFDNLSVYKASPVLSFNTLYEKSKWKIISVFKTNTYESQGKIFNYLRSTFANDYDFLNFVYQLKLRSVIDCPVDVNESDELVTLSTCAYDFDGFRQVIVARKVRVGESSKVDVSKAKLNSNPLYPDVWYTYYGGKKPEQTTFQDALNKKKISWYDGTLKWSKTDDTKLANTLQTYKNNAEKRIRKTYKEEDYTDSQLASIQEIFDIYMPYVRRSEAVSEVNDLCKQAIALIANFEPTRKKQLEEEKANEKKLKTIRGKAIQAMKDSISGKKYDQTNQAKVNSIIDTYTKKINSSSESSQIESLKNTAISELASVTALSTS